MPWIFLACAAWAADRELARGDLVLDRASLAVEVTRVAVPEPVAEPPEDPADRVCRANASYEPAPPAPPGGTPRLGRVTFAPTGCHPLLSAAVAEAVSRWSLQLRPPPSAQQDILVAWFVFPETAAGAVELAISVVPGTEVIAMPEGITVATMAHPTRRAPVLPRVGEPGSCDAVAKIDEGGAPYNFAIEGCRAELADAVRSGLLDWRFSPAQIGDRPSRVRVPMTVRFAPDGTAAVRLAPAADDDMRYLADDPSAAREAAAALLPPVPPLPEGPPILTVHHRHYAPVEIYTMPLPGPTDAPARCTVALQVRSDRRTYAWTEEPCDAAVRDPALAAANSWLLRPSEERAEHEVFARFRADFWWREAGVAPIVVLDEREIRSEGEIPPEVMRYTPPEPIRRVAPKRAEGLVGTCTLAVDLDAAGRPRELEALECPPELLDAATGAVRRWRWSPARVAGERVTARTSVSVRFR